MGYRERDRENNYQNAGRMVDCHNHELQGSVKTADQDDPHQHRFCTVTGEAIPNGDVDHVHDVAFMTDTFDNHHHEFRGRTGCMIPVGDGRHVHFIDSVTSVEDGHRHRFEAATLIENPTGMEHKHNECEEDHMHHNMNMRYR